MGLDSGFRLHEWQVRPTQNRLIGEDGEIRVTPRAMQVLVCLAESAGDVVTREDFNERVWQPAIVTDDALTRCVSELRRHFGDRADDRRFIETIPKRGYRLVAPVEPVDATDQPPAPALSARSGQPAERAPNSIAVLPFEPIGAATAVPIADGIHHDLLTRLSGIAGLRVISSTSVRRYRDTELGLPEIAAELGVTWIVEGAVQQAGEYFQVNVQLIDAADDRHLWARTYREAYSAGDLFAIQGEILDDIASSLEATLDIGERGRDVPAATGDLEAYSRYMQGRSFLDTRTEPGMRQALVYFRAALERDPGYALAWVGVADAAMLLYDYYNQGPPERVRPEVEKALDRALQIDPELAEAHASRGLYHMSHAAFGALRAEGLAGSQAVAWLQRAVELQPGYAEAWNWLAWVLQLLGHADQALACANTAIGLNPLSPEAIHNVMSSNMAMGHFGRGLREARRIEELGMYHDTPRFYEGVALHHLGRYNDAVGLLEGLQVEWAGAGPQAALALAEAARANSARAEALLEAIEAAEDHFAAGLCQAALGRTDAAFDAFARIERWGQWPALVMHHYYPEVLGPLRADPRFAPVLVALRAYYGLQEDGRLSVRLKSAPENA